MEALMPAPQTLWSGKVDGVDSVVMGLGDDDCYVQQVVDGEWQAVDDDKASRVYIAAFLEVRSALADLYDRDMGKQNLAAGVESLQNAARVLGVEE
jgi:hypothetical protein